MDEAPEPAATEDEADPGWPIGFMIFAGLAALYLGWRAVQLTGRLITWLF
ncbi:MAG TPA: hypothetical protein VGC11_06680 [Acidimicrobiia bacterium]|jgi:hypothetical protein